jgi:hypothetical protein
VPADQRVWLPGLPEYRESAARRRAEAFCDAPEYVFGIEVKPLTPATFSMLLATGNRFLSSDAPGEADIRNYLWFHSPLYAHCGVRTWPLRKRWALRRFTRHCAQPWRRWLGLQPSVAHYGATLLMAATDIRGLINAAFADAAPASGSASAPIATLEGQLIHLFAQTYQWAPERTRRTPLRQLFQLHRLIRSGSGDEVRDATEEHMLAAHLRRRQSALDAARATAAQPSSVNSHG